VASHYGRTAEVNTLVRTSQCFYAQITHVRRVTRVLETNERYKYEITSCSTSNLLAPTFGIQCIDK